MGLLFITFGFSDLIDILLVAAILYQLYKLVRGTVAMNIFVGLMLLYLVWLIVKFLNLSLLSTILDSFISVGVIAVIILFQQEIRKFLLLLGNTDFMKKRFALARHLSDPDSFTTSENTLREIGRACRDMSKTKTGALIVLTDNSELATFAQSGDTLNADVSHRLIESIFFKNSPMHDGAMIIVGNKITAARCVLPIDDDLVLPPHLGLRHRAALSMSNETEASIVVVSEETGSISLVRKGEIKYDITPETLMTMLRSETSATKQTISGTGNQNS